MIWHSQYIDSSQAFARSNMLTLHMQSTMADYNAVPRSLDESQTSSQVGLPKVNHASRQVPV